MGIVRSKVGPQRRAVRPTEWTKNKRAIFLETLAMSCNARAAATAAGKRVGSAYALRRRDAEFAMLWREAFVAGRERLHEELIAYSLGQIPSGDNPDPAMRDTVEAAPVAFDVERAIAILKLQGGLGGGVGRAPRAAATPAEIDAALMLRLEEMAARRGSAR